eukprot:m.163149 g.163149  ORF g.163149 m.163149 type:complete len:85 (+) comp14623_c0_seq1:33-287(+)
MSGQYIKYFDKNTGRPYWYNVDTNATQWMAPIELAAPPQDCDTVGDGWADAVGFDTTGGTSPCISSFPPPRRRQPRTLGPVYER